MGSISAPALYLTCGGYLSAQGYQGSYSDFEGPFSGRFSAGNDNAGYGYFSFASSLGSDGTNYGFKSGEFTVGSGDINVGSGTTTNRLNVSLALTSYAATNINVAAASPYPANTITLARERFASRLR